MNEKLLKVLNALVDEMKFNVEFYKLNGVSYIRIPIGSKTGTGDLLCNSQD